MPASVFSFGEWLPDLPAFNNPGLIEAKNVIPREGGYVPFPPLGAGFNYATLPSTPYGGIWAYNYNSIKLYMGASSSLNMVDGTGAWTNISAAVYAVDFFTEGWSFSQFENLVLAATPSRRLQKHTIGSASTFTLLSVSGEAPFSEQVGRVGQFVVALNNRQTTTASVDISVRWSAVADSENWPTPGSATAIATQSGEQFLDERSGKGTGVVANDQFGLIFQSTAITRMTYVGGAAVFQFDKISAEIGTVYSKSIVPLGGKFYFLTRSGVYYTDGVSVASLSAGKIDRWLFSSQDGFNFISQSVINERDVWGALDVTRKIIMWGYSRNSGSNGKILVYNYDENRFSWADQSFKVLLTYPSVDISDTYGRITGFAFDSVGGGYLPASFVEWFGTLGPATVNATALLITGDIEPNPGGRSFVSGVKPLVVQAEQYNPTTTASVLLRVGARNDTQTTTTYSATMTPTTRTGFADCRIDARYIRAELSLTGYFHKAVGLEYRVITTGDV